MDRDIWLERQGVRATLQPLGPLERPWECTSNGTEIQRLQNGRSLLNLKSKNKSVLGWKTN